ncbi:putative mfs monocarboxylate transporter protein [Neofusicoccum parvum]|uniref:Mfs monocarboxylate transporter protein n=1 Tax=Neofusicoccum parvum TaxID=310453 RepID=A0ACB5SLP0_9PEZI|nr:putative mfs monocarboxylate transporter protein [Neofusicoccum parvum]
MASTTFERLAITIPHSPDLASLYSHFQRPWPMERRATLPAYNHSPEDSEDGHKTPSDQSSDANEKKDDKIEVKLPGRPHSAYIVRDLGYSTYDYHKALCHIRKKEDRVQRKREKAIRAFAIDTDYHVPSISSRNSTHTLLQTSSNGSKDTKAGTISSNEAFKTEPSWGSSSTMVSMSGGSLPLRCAPDGGTPAWLQAIAGFFVTFNCWSLPFVFGILEPHYRSYYFTYTTSQIAWIGSTQLALLFLTAPIVSHIYDRGAFRLLFNGGTILLAAEMLATSWCRSWLTLFIVQGLLTGCTLGMVCCAYTRVLRGWFDKNLGVAMGIGAFGASAGGITYTLTVAYVLPKVGFEWTYRILSLIMITTMLFPTFVLRPWCGEQKMKASKVISTRRLLDFSFLLMLLGMFLSFWALYFPYFYITTYATTTLSLHPSPGHVCSFLITLLAATFPGRILPALLSDRFIGPLTTLIPSVLLSATFIYLWTGIRTKAPFYLLTGLYGFSSAAIVTLYAPTALAFARQPAADFVLVTHKGQETGSAGMKGGDGVNTKKTPFTNFRSI